MKLCAWLLVGALGPLGKGRMGLAPLGPIAYYACHLLFLRFCACLLCLSVQLTFSIHLGEVHLGAKLLELQRKWR